MTSVLSDLSDLSKPDGPCERCGYGTIRIKCVLPSHRPFRRTADAPLWTPPLCSGTRILVGTVVGRPSKRLSRKGLIDRDKAANTIFSCGRGTKVGNVNLLSQLMPEGPGCHRAARLNGSLKPSYSIRNPVLQPGCEIGCAIGLEHHCES